MDDKNNIRHLVEQSPRHVKGSAKTPNSVVNEGPFRQEAERGANH
jgi:hypothetical protein